MRKVGLYLISDPIAYGHLGVVHKAEHSGTHQKLAVKVISLQDLQPRQRTEMENEARMLMTVTSPHILKLVEYVRTPSHCYMFMELCPGGNLEMRIQQKGPAPEDLARKWLRELVLVLVDLRRVNLIHRDLKLSHVLLTSEDEASAEIKLSGFGFSKHAPENALTRSGLGTPIYMAPEVLRGQLYTYKVDVWSLGVLIYRLLLAQDPYNVTSLDQLKSAQERPIAFSKYCSLSSKAKSLITDLMQFQRDLRPDFNQILAHPFFREEIPAAPIQIRPPETRETVVKVAQEAVLKPEEMKAVPQRLTPVKAVNVVESPVSKERSTAHDPSPRYEEPKSTPKLPAQRTGAFSHGSPQSETVQKPVNIKPVESSDTSGREETKAKVSVPEPVGPVTPHVIEEQTPHLVIARVPLQSERPTAIDPTNVFRNPASFQSIKRTPAVSKSDPTPSASKEVRESNCEGAELAYSIIEISPLEDEYSIISPSLEESEMPELATEDVKKLLPLAARFRSKSKDSVSRTLLLVCENVLNQSMDKGARLLRGFSMQESYISTLIEHMQEKKETVQRALDALGPGTKATSDELLSELKALMTIAAASLPLQKKELYNDALLIAKVGIRENVTGEKAPEFYRLAEQCQALLKTLTVV